MVTGEYHQLKVVAIIKETNESKTFVLQPLDDWQPVYQSGQFLTLVFKTKYGEKRRNYSISSSPVLHEPLSITVKRVENGEFSRWILSKVKVGDVLEASGINGFFVLPADMDTADQFFFLAAGSGITPCYPVITTLLATTSKRVVLVYSNRSEEETIFLQKLKMLMLQYADRLQIHFLFSNKLSTYNGRLGNWLLLQLLKRYIQVPASRVMFYLCGPFEYMQMIHITLLAEGFAASHIRKENFNTLPAVVRVLPPDTDAHTVRIHFQNTTHAIGVQYPKTVLAAARAAGVDLPYSCEAGRCGSCAATVVNGEFWMAYNEVLLDEEIQKGLILCCQAYPVGTDGEITV